MARPAAGFTVRPHRITGIQQVRFTHQGRQLELSTGTRDPVAAAPEAARIYAEVISGRWVPGAVEGLRPGTALDEPASLWLAAVETTLDRKTIAQYEMYVRTHWTPFFASLDRVTTPSVNDYTRHRLRDVKRKTLLKELSALRGFLRWCEEQKLIQAAPYVPPPPPKATGTPSSRPHKSDPVHLEEEQVRKILAALPEMSAGRKPFPVRARFIVAWETGLRPATLDEIESPGDYRPGATTLRIRDEVDKNRFGREVPLSPAARAALDSCIDAPGLIFGRRDYREYLKASGKAAGLSVADAKALSPYDLRHARGTHLVAVSGDLPGVAYLLGHKQVTTTNRYVHGSLKAAQRVLAAAAPGRGFQGHSRGKRTTKSAKGGN